MPDPVRAEVAIVGAGISGLSVAYFLRRQGRDVLVLERDDRVGGAVRSVRTDGYLVEEGPNSTLETTPLLTEMITRLGLDGGKLYADPVSDNRYILRNGALHALPMSPGAFLATPLFSTATKLGLFREPFVRRAPDGADESVAAFVRRRLGREFLDYAINPFVAGVYAGDPARLSVRAAFPKLAELERTYGSLIVGQIHGARARRKRSETSKQRAKMFSFRDGMETLPLALARFAGRVETGAAIRSIVRVPDADGRGERFALHVAHGDGDVRELRCRSLVISAQAYSAAALVSDLAPGASAALAAIAYPPVASVATGFPADVPGMHALDGFGFLVPEVENRRILGTIFTSAIFPARAPAGSVLLTTFLGGSRQPGIAGGESGSVADTALGELRALLGTPAHAPFVRVRQWERAIPQYEGGHLDRIAAVEQAERDIPGLFFCANYRGGISVGDCVRSAADVAARL